MNTDKPAWREYRFLQRLVLLAVLLGCAFAFSMNLVDPDLWGHVQYGQDWIADGKLPATASHTFTAPEHPWVNHENLAELTFAFGVKYLGVTGLLVAKCILGMAILGLMALVARWHGVSSFMAWCFFLLIANNLTAFFPVRPQLLSFACCALMLVLLDRSFAKWYGKQFKGKVFEGAVQFRWLMLVPLLMVVWVNSHGGFVAGLCILGAYLGGRLIELLVHTFRQTDQDNSTEHRTRKQVIGTFVLLSIIGLVSLATILANPYGTGLVDWLVESLGSPRPEITEWAAPHPRDPVFWPFMGLLAVTLIALAWTKQRRDWVQVAILAIVALQATMHLRHIAFFALLCGFWLPEHVQSVCHRMRKSARQDMPVIQLSTWLQRTATLALIGAIGLQSIGLLNRLTNFPVHRTMYPVDAVQFMSERNMEGKLVVCFNWAQYAIAALSPEVRVSFDGRFRTCYPQEVVDMNFDFLLGEHGGKRHRAASSGPVDPQRVLNYCEPDMVLLDRQYRKSVEAMEAATADNDSTWVLLYQDSVAQLWGRSNLFADPENSRFIPEPLRFISNHRSNTTVQWPAFPKLPIKKVSLDSIQNTPQN